MKLALGPGAFFLVCFIILTPMQGADQFGRSYWLSVARCGMGARGGGWGWLVQESSSRLGGKRGKKNWKQPKRPSAGEGLNT